MLHDVWIELGFGTDEVGVLDVMVEGGDIDHVILILSFSLTSPRLLCHYREYYDGLEGFVWWLEMQASVPS